MVKDICILQANCQGDSLQYLLQATPAFAEKFHIFSYSNYLRHKIDAKTLEQCKLFLFQELGEKWGELSSAQLLQKVSSSCHVLQIPNMFFNGYWPLFTNDTFMAYGDIILEDLCARGLSAAEVHHLYTKGNLLQKYNLEALRENSYAKELHKEQNLSIKTLPFIEEFWREEQLFYTVNHPAPPLSLYVANRVLQELELGEIPADVANFFMQKEEEFIQPIHPQLASIWQLPFASAQRIYPVYGQNMNFSNYINAYVHCRLQSGEDAVKDFVVFLHLLAKKRIKDAK